jgi:phosphate-selective porin OprO/OprP
MRAFALLIVLISTTHALAQAPSSPGADQRIAELERRLAELENGRTTVHGWINFSTEGFTFIAPQNQAKLHVGGLIQADGRLFLADEQNQLPDTFLLRRLRPIIDATFFNWIDARIVPDFGQNRAVLQDGYLDVHPWEWLQLRAGKFKPPVGLERLQQDRNYRFMERALPTDLVPSRDVGVMLWGQAWTSALTWFLGVFNGVPDGADQPDTDLHDGKDFEVRVFAHPFRPLRNPWLNNLGIGFAGTYGNERGTVATPNLPTYKSAGQNTFFSYDLDPSKPDGTTVADGARWRVAPQAYYYGGPIGVLLEYYLTAQEVRRGIFSASVGTQAWNVTVNAMLTPGDRATYGDVVPKHLLTLDERGWGAFEISVRYNELRVSDVAFPNFADPTKSARVARAYGVVINWYANRHFRATAEYDRTDYTGGAKGGDREPENALMGRLQAAF